MTNTRLDTAKFKAACQREREFIYKLIADGVWSVEGFSNQSYSEKKDWYDFSYDRLSWTGDKPSVPSIFSAEELRSALNVAAGTAMSHGATKAQIDEIVFLASQSGEFNILGGDGRLTRADANRIINSMI